MKLVSDYLVFFVDLFFLNNISCQSYRLTKELLFRNYGRRQCRDHNKFSTFKLFV